LTEGQEKQVGYIRDSGAGLYELIDDLLDIARVEAGKVELRPVEFEVADVFGALRGMMKAVDVKPAVSLVIEEPCGIPPLLADENKVTQILRNLVSNALKFTERGQVRVSAQMDPGGAAVVFSVSDTGIGIAPEDQERVFEEFVQLDSPVQRSVKGTGLGLPLSRSLAEVLGGSLSVESQPGVGSTFTAVIPVVCSTVDAAATGVTASVQELDENRSPVLIVEDDLETVQLYENYLKGSGFQIIRAATAAEARKMLAECKPMAIVLDILLPGEDGWVLLSDLNGDATTRDIPVLVVTIVKDEQKAMALGAHDYCLKPVGQRWLLGKLEALSPVEKVLIIDDEEVSRYLFKGLLADTKYTLLEAASGAEGLRRAREEQPQAIFLDLIMPEMDGFEVLKQLRSDPDTRNIPVVVYTSRKLDHGERQWLSQRAVAIVQKDGQPREAAIAQLKDALVKARQSSREPAGESPDE
jgi:CheY-like chemotaxis protein/anti-sigma regulatory factor (Ser/Thr protein kinase)